MIQQSFKNENNTLYIVATPIGNLSEMTPRAIETLQNVDVIACEDTRTSLKLLQYFNIKKRLIAYHNFNEKSSSEGILKLLHENQNVAIISDAGYPLLCDPGMELTRKVIDANYNVVTISGSNAALNALVSSGLPVHPFYFYGFLSANQTQRLKQLHHQKSYDCTLVYYESPHRINKTLADMLSVFGNRNICIARELTKQHEEYIRTTLSEVQNLHELKGEIVIIVDGKKTESLEIDDFLAELNDLIANGMRKSEAIKVIAKKYNLSKNELYDKIHK